MTPLQRITLRLSEVRQRLNEIAGLEGDQFTDEVRNEATALQTEFAGLEVRHRSALIAEGETEAQRRGEFDQGDAEARERSRLIRETRLADYLGPASSGSGIAGRAVELNASLDAPVAGRSGGVAIPWELFGTPEARDTRQDAEHRAFTSTSNYDGGVLQRPILQRLFGYGIADVLGVRMDAVPAGRSEWPLIRTGVSPAQKPEGTAADAPVEAGIVGQTLKPKRLTGAYEYTHEAMASVPDLEQALRRDLADAVTSKMNSQILLGNETSNAEDVDGFLTKLTAPTAPTAEADFEAYASSFASGVDGIHASSEGEVTAVVGTASYRHAASKYQSGSGEAASEAMTRRGGGLMASNYVPAPASDIQNGNIFHLAGPNGGGAMRGDSIAAIWPTLEVIRDIYSKASQGVVLTWVTLWDAETAFRAAAYERIAFKLAP